MAQRAGHHPTPPAKKPPHGISSRAWRHARVGEGLDGALHGVPVVKGLAHPHEDDIAHRRQRLRPRHLRALVRLQQNLPRRQRAPPPHRARRAESARHRAAHLARDADGRARGAVGRGGWGGGIEGTPAAGHRDHDRLDGRRVLEPKHHPAGAASRANGFAGGRLGQAQHLRKLPRAAREVLGAIAAGGDCRRRLARPEQAPHRPRPRPAAQQCGRGVKGDVERRRLGQRAARPDGSHGRRRRRCDTCTARARTHVSTAQKGWEGVRARRGVGRRWTVCVRESGGGRRSCARGRPSERVFKSARRLRSVQDCSFGMDAHPLERLGTRAARRAACCVLRVAPRTHAHRATQKLPAPRARSSRHTG